MLPEYEKRYCIVLHGQYKLWIEFDLYKPVMAMFTPETLFSGLSNNHLPITKVISRIPTDVSHSQNLFLVFIAIWIIIELLLKVQYARGYESYNLNIL